MKNLKKWLVLLAALFVLTGMTSCEMFDDDSDSLAIIGEWVYSADATTADKEITSSEYISYYDAWAGSYDAGSYNGDIVSFDNNGWNENEIGTGEYGYFVVKFTNTPPWATANSRDGKYMVVRWEELSTTDGVTTMQFSEGTDYPTNTYYDSAEEAIEGATGLEGESGSFFSSYSPMTKLD